MSSSIEFDLYKWMPGHGENKVSTVSKGSGFQITFYYDGLAGKQESKTLTFSKASYYSVGTFPGVNAIPYKYDFSFNSGKLLKLNTSDFSNEWRDHWKKSQVERNCNHYVIFFVSENKVIHVISESVEIS